MEFRATTDWLQMLTTINQTVFNVVLRTLNFVLCSILFFCFFTFSAIPRFVTLLEFLENISFKGQQDTSVIAATWQNDGNRSG